MSKKDKKDDISKIDEMAKEPIPFNKLFNKLYWGKYDIENTIPKEAFKNTGWSCRKFHSVLEINHEKLCVAWDALEVSDRVDTKWHQLVAEFDLTLRNT